MDVSRDLTFGGIEVYAIPRVELLDYVQKRNHIINRVGEESAVIGVPLTSQFAAARGDVVSLALVGGEPSNEWFNHQVEKEGR